MSIVSQLRTAHICNLFSPALPPLDVWNVGGHWCAQWIVTQLILYLLPYFPLFPRICYRRSPFLCSRCVFEHDDAVEIVPSDLSFAVSNTPAVSARAVPLSLQNSGHLLELLQYPFSIIAYRSKRIIAGHVEIADLLQE
jgi:hypothetical protein